MWALGPARACLQAAQLCPLPPPPHPGPPQPGLANRFTNFMAEIEQLKAHKRLKAEPQPVLAAPPLLPPARAARPFKHEPVKDEQLWAVPIEAAPVVAAVGAAGDADGDVEWEDL